MSEIIACPHCQRKLQLPAEHLGHDVECASCGRRFVAEKALPVVLIEAPEFASEQQLVEGMQAGTGVSHRRKEALPLHESPPLPPPSGSVGRVLVGIGILFLVFCVLVGGIVMSQHRPVRGPVVVQVNREDEDKRRLEIMQAFRNQKPLEPDEIGKEIRPFLDSLGAALRAQDAGRLGNLFDGDRLLDELVAAGAVTREFARRPGVAHATQQGIGQALQQQAPLMEWTETDIKNIKKLDGNEAVVIARHRGPQGASLKMRWWVSKRSGTWKIFDMEDLDVGMRVTHAGVTLLGAGFAAAQKTAKDVQELREALHAIVLFQDAEGAEKKLKGLAGVQFPGELEAIHQLVVGLIHLHRARDKEALQAFDKAEKARPDMPGLNLMRAITYNNLGQSEKAIRFITAYKELLGDDATVCMQLGSSLLSLRRNAEACAQFRKALDYEPKSEPAFLSLLRALQPGDSKTDLGARFAKLNDPRGQFEICVEDCRDGGDWEAVELISLAMRKIHPADDRVDYWLALAKIGRGEVEEGVKLFQTALKQQKDPVQKEKFRSGFMQTMSRAGKAAEAYAAIPDAREAFRTLTKELALDFRTDELRKILDLHGKKEPNDPLIPLYRGRVYFDDGDYAKADKEFTVAAANKLDWEQFRHDRITARYYLGQGLQAYRDFEPKEAVFTQLAGLCIGDNDLRLLEDLIVAHSAAATEQADLLRFRLSLNIRKGRPEIAIGLLKNSGVTVPQDKWKSLVFTFVNEMTDAGRGFEAYGAIPDKEEAFQLLASNLLGAGHIEDLRRLVKFHQEKHPGDPLQRLYVGELHLIDKEWDKAVEALGEGYRRAPNEHKIRYEDAYLDALLAAGKTGEAMDVIEEQEHDYAFEYLAGALLAQKKLQDVERLINAYSARHPGSAEAAFYEARLRARNKQDALAVSLLKKAHGLQTAEHRANEYVREFALDMKEEGRGLEAYRTSPDRKFAFDTLAQSFVNKKQDKDLEALIQAHQQDFPQDPRLKIHRGELHLLRGEAALATKHFEAARSAAGPNERFSYEIGFERARIMMGRTVETYRELGGGTRVFNNLAGQCVADKNGEQLKLLLAAHREVNPDFADVPAWEMELRWLAKDYAGVVESIDALRKNPPSWSRYRWKAEGYLVRSLINLKRTKEALEEAEKLAKGRFGNRNLVMLTHASTGDVKATVAAAQRWGPRQDFLRSWYGDEALGPILRSPKFEAFREHFPEPPQRSRYREDFDRFDD